MASPCLPTSFSRKAGTSTDEEIIFGDAASKQFEPVRALWKLRQECRQPKNTECMVLTSLLAPASAPHLRLAAGLRNCQDSRTVYQYSLGTRSGSVFCNRINSKSSTQEACCKRCLDPESITIGSIATLLLLSLEKRSTAPKPYGSLFIALLAIFQRLQYMFKAPCIS